MRSGRTEEMFRELQAWCLRQDSIGPTPRLVVQRDMAPGAILMFDDKPGGPEVHMAPATYSNLRRWVDGLEHFVM